MSNIFNFVVFSYRYPSMLNFAQQSRRTNPPQIFTFFWIVVNYDRHFNFLWISLTVKILLKTITYVLPLMCPPPSYYPAYAFRFPPWTGNLPMKYPSNWTVIHNGPLVGHSVDIKISPLIIVLITVRNSLRV